MKKLLITLIVVIVVAGAAGGAYYYKYGKPPDPEISTLQISRGDVIQQVGATGTVEAVTTVDVGTQVSGIIRELYVDFNKIVKKGQLIAKIDPATIEATIQQHEANLESANANLERQIVALEDSKNKLKRAEDLFKRNLITQVDLETAQVAVKTNEAQVKAQKASINQIQAQLNQDHVNLNYTNIYAPIDGIVINRKVDIGQTVVSNNMATSMFQIAEDLTKMQLKASVDESDVGMLRPGQVATFRVDAYLNKEFSGTVSQVRLQPVVTQNVVTYTTIINVPNPDLELKPGMTANVKIEIARRENVLRVPNAALRYRPTREIFEALKLEVPPELQQRGRGMRSGDRAAMSGGQGRTALAGSQQGGTRNSAASERGGGDRPPQATERQTSLRRSGEGQQAGTGQQRSGQAAQGGGRGGQQAQGEGAQRQRGGQGGNWQQMTPEERQKRMQERLANMTPEERARFEERMKQFGQSGGFRGGQGGQGAQTGRFAGSDRAQAAGGNRGMAGRGRAATTAGAGESIADRGFTTIDALFGELTFPTMPGRVWLYAVDGTKRTLKSVSVRTGISDGTWTELVDAGTLDDGTQLVTNIDTGQQNTQQMRTNSPFMPGRPMGGPGGFGGRGR